MPSKYVSMAVATSVAVTALTLTSPTAPATAVPAQGRAEAALSADCNAGQSVLQLQAAMKAGAFTSLQLTTCYLNAISAQNPVLNAVIEDYPLAATAAAAESDAYRLTHAGNGRSALDGIPVLLKDNVANQEIGAHTTAGSQALLSAATPADAFLTAKLRSAGAVIVGKANMSEWSDARSSPSSNGWSARSGQTHNPFALDRDPCGSSSGSAVAAAAGLAGVTIGTETDGSINCPAGMNGVVGFKPTLGLVSRTGVVPVTPRQDTPGPITRSVTDAAVLLNSIQGVDPADPATAATTPYAGRDYTTGLNPSLAGKRIGVWNGRYAGFFENADVTRVLDNTVTALEAAGATVVDVNSAFDIDDLLALSAAENTALSCEFKTAINSYLPTRTGPGVPVDLASLIAFNTDHAATELPPVQPNQNEFLASQTTAGDDAACAAARSSATTTARSLIDNAIGANNLYAIVGPSNGPAGTTITQGDGFDASDDASSSTPAAVAGYPNISVPAGAGCNNQLPIGMSFFAGRWSEPALVNTAYAFEQQTHDEIAPPSPFPAHVTC